MTENKLLDERSVKPLKSFIFSDFFFTEKCVCVYYISVCLGRNFLRDFLV